MARTFAWPIAAVFLALCGAFAGCARHPAPAEDAVPVVALPVHVQADRNLLGQLPVEIDARYSNALSFRIAGKLIERTVRLGDVVRAGQVVARLDPADVSAQATAAAAALAAAEHHLTWARQQLDRDRAQAAQNLIASAQLEQTQDVYANALAARDQAAGQATVAHDNLDYATLRADQDGVIASENADTGQVLAAGQAVFGLAHSGEVDAVADAPQSLLAGLVVGQSATVTLPALPGVQLPARVREIAGSADPQSRTWRIKLALTQPPASVHLGMTGDAQVLQAAAASSANGGPGSVVILPATALFHQGTQPAVWVVGAQDGNLSLRPVTVGRFDARTFTVTQGLADGEVVVRAGVNTVHAGEHVRTVAPLYNDDAGAAR